MAGNHSYTTTCHPFSMLERIKAHITYSLDISTLHWCSFRPKIYNKAVYVLHIHHLVLHLDINRTTFKNGAFNYTEVFKVEISVYFRRDFKHIYQFILPVYAWFPWTFCPYTLQMPKIGTHFPKSLRNIINFMFSLWQTYDLGHIPVNIVKCNAKLHAYKSTYKHNHLEHKLNVKFQTLNFNVSAYHLFCVKVWDTI
jgi:hypothetical protein